MQTIKNVLFDLGKVLLDFDNENAKKHFISMGVADYDVRVMKLHTQHVFTDVETGKLSEQQFIDKISTELGGHISETEIRNAWNSILIRFRTESMKHLERLKERYGLYLLSNTNAIHHQEFNKMLFDQLNTGSLDSYFTKAYYSYQTGMRKPDIRIYELVLRDAGIEPASTLFIDDLPENIAAASTLGFHTHLLLPEERIENLQLLTI